MGTIFFLCAIIIGLLLTAAIAVLSPTIAIGKNRKTLQEVLSDKGNKLLLLFVAAGLCFIVIAILGPLLFPIPIIEDHRYISTLTPTP